jgi:hypothetical protein
MRLTSCSLSYSKKSVYVCMHILLSIFFLPFFLLRWKMALTGTCPKVNTYGNKVPFLLDDTTWRVIKPVNSRVPYVTDDERRHRQRTSRPCRLQTKLKVTFHSVTRNWTVEWYISLFPYLFECKLPLVWALRPVLVASFIMLFSRLPYHIK